MINESLSSKGDDFNYLRHLRNDRHYNYNVGRIDRRNLNSKHNNAWITLVILECSFRQEYLTFWCWLVCQKDSLGNVQEDMFAFASMRLVECVAQCIHKQTQNEGQSAGIEAEIPYYLLCYSWCHSWWISTAILFHEFITVNLIVNQLMTS